MVAEAILSNSSATLESIWTLTSFIGALHQIPSLTKMLHIIHIQKRRRGRLFVPRKRCQSLATYARFSNTNVCARVTVVDGVKFADETEILIGLTTPHYYPFFFFSKHTRKAYRYAECVTHCTHWRRLEAVVCVQDSCSRLSITGSTGYPRLSTE